MRIEQKNIFIFTESLNSQDYTFPIPANTAADAAEIFKAFLSKIMMNLALEFPSVSKVSTISPVQPVENASALLEELRVIALVDQIAVFRKQLPRDAKKGISYPEAVKKLTDLDHVPENYALIISKLEAIRKENDEIIKGK